MKRTLAGLLVVTLVVTTVAATATSASAQRGRGVGWHGGGWHGGGWHGGGWGRRAPGWGWGPGVGVGILGGAIVAGAILASRPAGYVVYPGYAQPVSGPGCY